MFKVVKEITFKRTVSVFTPVDGGFREESCQVTYLAIPVDEAAHYSSTEEGSTAFLQRVVRRMDDLTDANDKPVEYSDALRDDQLRWPHVRLALSAAYHAALSKVKAGN